MPSNRRAHPLNLSRSGAFVDLAAVYATAGVFVYPLQKRRVHAGLLSGATCSPRSPRSRFFASASRTAA